jgi:hypothetical protein
MKEVLFKDDMMIGKISIKVDIEGVVDVISIKVHLHIEEEVVFNPEGVTKVEEAIREGSSIATIIMSKDNTEIIIMEIAEGAEVGIV